MSDSPREILAASISEEPVMTAPSSSGATDALVATFIEALAAGTPEAFTALLTDDIRWGGEHRGGNECTTRDQAGDHYGSLLAAGVTLRVTDLQQADPTEPGVLSARIQVRSPDAEDFPPEMAIRLIIRDGLIADIRILGAPPTIEVLYLDDCPHHEAFLPHLNDLLAEHCITAPITLIRINNDEEARAHRFLGSPTVRIDGHDVEPAAAQRQLRSAEDANGSGGSYGMQCRLYPTREGTTGAPRDEWIIDALIDDQPTTSLSPRSTPATYPRCGSYSASTRTSPRSTCADTEGAPCCTSLQTGPATTPTSPPPAFSKPPPSAWSHGSNTT